MLSFDPWELVHVKVKRAIPFRITFFFVGVQESPQPT